MTSTATLRHEPGVATGSVRAVEHDRRARTKAHKRRMRAADTLTALAVISPAAAVALYLASGGFGAVHDPASAVTALGIVTGLVATNLLLLMVLLAARVPLLDRVFGHDRVIGVHRSIGKPAIYLLLTHAICVTVGYGMSDGSGPIRETISFLGMGLSLLAAYVGLGLLIAVVVTSLVSLRRRFTYELWHLVHLMSYLGVAIALPHQLSTGTVFLGTPQRLYWIGLYAVAFSCAGVYRFIVPTWRSLRTGLRIERIERVSADVFSVHVVGRDLDRLRIDGGQFAIWRFWSLHTWWHAHPVSFSAAPTNERARITVRVLGRGTARLAALRAGTRVSFEGPYGVFTDRARTAPYLTAIAAGIGVTPIRALLESSTFRPGEATVLLRASDTSQQVLWNEVAAVAQHQGGTVLGMTGHRPHGRSTWMSADAVAQGVRMRDLFPRLLDSDVYVCGPSRWTQLVLREARAAGVPAHRIHAERFDS